MFEGISPPGSHRPRLAVAGPVPLLVPVVACGHMIAPVGTLSVRGSRRWRRLGAVLPSPSMAQREALTKKELEELRASLLKEQEELRSQLAELEASTFSSPQSDISGETSFDEEYADSGTATFERERDLSVENNIKDLLDKIDKALSRMDEGTFGICERCGKPIEKARIKALPYASLCIKDKQAETRPR